MIERPLKPLLLSPEERKALDEAIEDICSSDSASTVTHSRGAGRFFGFGLALTTTAAIFGFALLLPAARALVF